MIVIKELIHFRVKAIVKPLSVVLFLLVSIINSSLAQSPFETTNLVLELAPSNSAPPANENLTEGEKRELEGSLSESQEVVSSLRSNPGSEEELIAQLGLLGVSHQTLEQHDLAIEILNEAISLTREHHGENNIQQIPLLEQLVYSYLAQNDIGRTDETENLIYALYQENYKTDDQEMFFATVNLADWIISAYFKENYGPKGMLIQQSVVPQTMRNTSSGGGDSATNAIFSGNVKELNNSDITDARVRRVGELYEEYQEKLIATGNPQLAVIVEIAKRTAALAYISKQEIDFERNNKIPVPNYDGSREQAARNSSERLDETYQNGRDALEYIISIFDTVPNIGKNIIAQSYMDLGDWHLAFGKVRPAENAYSNANQLLLDEGFTAANIDTALATPIPLQTPIFVTHLFSRGFVGARPGVNLNYQGYIDVSFNIDEIGNPENLRITDSSGDYSSNIERLIELQFRSIKFRPTISNGEMVSPGNKTLRYHFSY